MTHAPPKDRWEQGGAYERYMGRWSRRVGPEFLSWLGVPPALRWLDVGCGTGALCSSILARCAPEIVIGVEPSQGFLDSAQANLAGAATLHRGSAADIPLPDAAVDVTVSGLMLNFVPDPGAALDEMSRVTAAGGTVAAYVWDYAGRMDLLRLFWDAAVALDPASVAQDEGARFPLCRPDSLRELFVGAGLADVEVTHVDIPTDFARFDDYWEPFLGGQGPAPMYAMALDGARRTELRERLRRDVPTDADGSIHLIARAWAVRGTVGSGAQ